MSVGAILTLGYGSFGSVNLVPTLGYSVGSAPPSPIPDRPSNWKVWKEDWREDWREKWRKREEEEELERLERLLDKQLAILPDPIDEEIRQILTGELLAEVDIRPQIFEQVDYDLYQGVFEDVYAEIQKSLMEKKRNNMKIALLLLLN